MVTQEESLNKGWEREATFAGRGRSSHGIIVIRIPRPSSYHTTPQHIDVRYIIYIHSCITNNYIILLSFPAGLRTLSNSITDMHSQSKSTPSFKVEATIPISTWNFIKSTSFIPFIINAISKNKYG